MANFVGTIEHSMINNPLQATTKDLWTPHMSQAVIDPAMGEQLEYCQLIKRNAYRDIWTHSYANELGHLTQGVGDRYHGTNTIFFI
jgi:hypothetical protein